jgi:dUTP pyrophosphatase
MAKFEIVSKYADAGLSLPERATGGSAGYDFRAAEDIVIPPYESHKQDMNFYADIGCRAVSKTLDEIAKMTKSTRARPTLVPTGIKCKLDEGTYLKLAVRSSMPLKSWLVLANGEGVIDQDYYNNPDNEGEIYFQLINLTSYSIQIKKGDKIGQGIILPYLVTEDDKAGGTRKGGFGSTDE